MLRCRFFSGTAYRHSPTAVYQHNARDECDRAPMKFQDFGLALLMFWATNGLSQAPPPDLSGVWRLNAQASHFSGSPPAEMWVRLEQNGPDITITIRGDEEEVEKLRIGSDDNQGQIHGAPMKSAAKWDGSTLAVDSVATFGADELRMNDRWTLSPDGKSLTFQERHQFKTEPAGDETMVFDKQPNETWEPTFKPMTAELKYKNIQVMKGMPATRLMPVMMMFTKSLGIECSYCHVPGEFAKDDKPAKATARRMLKMVHQINDENFAETSPVSCWTCHRGSTKPESQPK